MKKKLLSILLIVVIVFNFILCNGVYADPGDSFIDYHRYGGNETLKGQAMESIINDGQDSNKNTFNHTGFGPTLVGVLLQSIAGFINTVPILIQGIMSIFTVNPTSSSEGFVTAGLNAVHAAFNSYKHFTIERAVFNEVSLFNINVFNQTESYQNGSGAHVETIVQSSAILNLKEATTGWFYSCRLIAMMLNLCILIYVGIRMALSTIASEEARYKKMLIHWAESMVVLFLLHYIMYAIIAVGEIIMNIVQRLRFNIIASGQTSFEDIILNQIYNAISQKGGIQFFMYSLFFWFLTALHLKFFLTYLKRTFTIMFLTVIAPFITVTYPIDKMGDGKAQAFEGWMQEYLINVAIQPIHAAIYLVFVFTAGEIAEQAPYVAMIFLLALGSVERMVRNIFGITGSVKNIDETRKGAKKGGDMMAPLKSLFGGEKSK